MKAMLVKENEKLEWCEVDDPIISDDEALVEVYLSPITYSGIT